ncbi:hypothetical protein ABTZ92_30545, partial [Streptomyces albidoflavus]|uniref:hypothetical protein n=1 Tax=Streptomyces albidoflavus TaxID=1886 RepID=UPI0033267091
LICPELVASDTVVTNARGVFDQPIAETITPNKNMVDLINYPTTPTPYETTITFSVVQGL